MQAALNSVVCDGISANKAAPQHRVSRSTLKDHLSGRVVHGRNPGSEPYLNVEEEQELVGHLINASNVGYGKTRQEVLNIFEWYVERKESASLRSSTVMHGWWQKFLREILHLVCELEIPQQALEWMLSMLKILKIIMINLEVCSMSMISKITPKQYTTWMKLVYRWSLVHLR